MLTTEAKAKIIAEHKVSDDDTGSPEVQIAIMSARIAYLTDHFKTHKQDKHSRRGLMRLVNNRRKLLDYLNAKDHERYKNLIAKLDLRK